MSAVMWCGKPLDEVEPIEVELDGATLLDRLREENPDNPLLRRGRGRPLGRRNSPTLAMLDRHKKAGQLFAAGLKKHEIAEELGLHPGYMSKLRQHKNVRESAEEIHAERKGELLDIRARVEAGAAMGLSFLEEVLTPGTEAYEDAKPEVKLRAAHDFLDREGTAPRVSRTQKDGHNVNLTVTGADILRIKNMAKQIQEGGPPELKSVSPAEEGVDGESEVDLESPIIIESPLKSEGSR